MAKLSGRGSILIAAATTKAYDAIAGIVGTEFGKTRHASSIAMTKQMLAQGRDSILILYVPMPDEPGVEAAAAIAAHHPNLGILLIVPAEEYNHIRYQTKDTGILILAKPITKRDLYEAVNMLSFMQQKIQKLTEENRKLRTRLSDMGIITQAKCLLIEKRQMTEQDAHRYLEKEAMDFCLPKVEVARNVITTLSDPEDDD